MTLLDHPHSGSADVVDDAVIDLTPAPGERSPRPLHAGPAPGPGAAPTPPVDGTRAGPRARAATGLRIRRVRLGSVAAVSSVFWLLAFAVLLGTVVAVWNIVQAFGFVDSFEETMITSLGLESFEIDGGGLFRVLAVGIGFLCGLGWVATLALAAVYNATAAVFGGLAIETGPLQRRHRVLSWRDRRFVTVWR